MTMYLHALKIVRISVALVALVLSACGGGGSDAPDPSRVLQESELYHPVTNTAGAVEQPGQTAVIGLQVDTSDLPPPSNLASKGVEDLWFEVKDTQSMQMELDADTLSAIDRLEVRDQNDALLATINASTPSTTLSLAPGRYQAVLFASAADSDPAAVFVQYASGQEDSTRVRGASASNTAQQQGALPWKLHFGRNCPGCLLSGKDFSGWDLQGSSFRGSVFTRANFTKAKLFGAKFDLTNLGEANFTEADLSWASLTGARLSLTNLSKANLTHANLSQSDLYRSNVSGANLSEARLINTRLFRVNFSEANLTSANLSSALITLADLRLANLSWATWVDGGRCKEGSIGTCNQ